MPWFGYKFGWFYTVNAYFRPKSNLSTVFSMSRNVPDLQNPAAHGLRGVFDLASALQKISIFRVF